MLLDRYGKLAVAEGETQPYGSDGGWVVRNASTPATVHHAFKRDFERTAARAAYMSNGLLFGAVNVIVSYIINDDFGYGDMVDARAQEALEDFWRVNKMGHLAERMLVQYLIDGEVATVFPKNAELVDVPAKVGLLDVGKPLTLEYDTLNGVTRLEADAALRDSMGVPGTRKEVWDEGEFVWLAHDALWNDPRGWPVIMRAVWPALAFTNLIQHRIRIHELQGRINAVYYALVDFSRGAESAFKLQQAKAAAYGTIPKNGAVVTLARDRLTGQSEQIDFLRPAQGATDAGEDARLIRLLVAAALNLPEHFLAEGGGVTRTTAAEMGNPARRGFKRRQAVVRRWLDELFQKELVRRFGPDQTYKVRAYDRSSDGTKTPKKRNKSVTADQVYVPWVFPSLATDDVAALVRKVEAAYDMDLASKQTLAGELGFDPSLEAERMSNETPKKPLRGRTGVPVDDDMDQTEED